MSFIHESASIRNSSISDVKVYRNVAITDSVLSNGCSIGDDTTIERCHFEQNVIVNRRSYVNDSIIGSYTYAGINLTMNWTRIGRFCSIGRNVDIGGFNHDYHKITTMPHFRFAQLAGGGGKIPEQMQNTDYCEIGNDVWIAAGAQVLHNVKIGNGAVIGGGAVVTKDVPPYAVVVGVPARVIAFRCAENLIEELEKIQWWNWPMDIIVQNANLLMDTDITEDSVKKLNEISKSINCGLENDGK